MRVRQANEPANPSESPGAEANFGCCAAALVNPGPRVDLFTGSMTIL